MRTITARQLANSYLARVADDVIHLLVSGEQAVQQGIVGNAANYREAAAGYSYSAPIIARSFWADMYGEGE